MSADDTPWTLERIEWLRELWAGPDSTAEIGRKMGITKNAAIGKAKRLGLVSRPSPIIRDGRPRRAPKPPRVRGPTLPRLVSLDPPPRAPVVVVESVPRPVADGAAAEAPSLPASMFKPRAAGACCWPYGDPRRPDFRFCDAIAIDGRPYCLPHCEVAYVASPDRRRDAA